jgi:predicted RNA-binding Zn-ribbon protein involved in translation (DUF1610 family)
MAGNQKFCPNCGTPNALEAAFCLSCGSKFPAFPPQGTPAAAPVQPPAAGPAVPPLPQVSNGDFITLSCPNCGGKLNITPDINRFACQFCGHEHIVRRHDGVVALEEVMGQINQNINAVGSGIQRLSGSAEKQASEIAIGRLKEEIVAIQKKIEEGASLTRNIWFAVLGSGGIAVFGWIAGYAEEGVNSSLEHTFKILGGVGTALAILVALAAIAASVEDGKRAKKQQEIIYNKQQELSYHYRVVSGQ